VSDTGFIVEGQDVYCYAKQQIQLIDIVHTLSYILIMQIFKWNAEKNEILARERGITFEEIVIRIELGAKILETDHPNKKKYPNQKILIIDVDGYAYLVPCVVENNEYFLKTIIPSRKATKKYLGGLNG
jgi:uncharacterized DUF497 family protein